MNTRNLALIIGNSDGIGLGLTKRLLGLGWRVHGVSRSACPVEHEAYSHDVVDVSADDFNAVLTRAAAESPAVCVYCVGIGEPLDTDNLGQERQVFEVNLMGAIRTLELVLPGMLKRSNGHCLVLSSIADEVLMPEAPSYAASKAGLSSYIEGLGLALRDRGVAVTNIRFGFVDTKMAKGDQKPFLMTVDRAVDHLLSCIRKRPIRFTRPRVMGLLVCVVRWVTKLKLKFY